MNAWEYTIAGSGAWERLGTEGWELVAVDARDDRGFFKRLKSGNQKVEQKLDSTILEDIISKIHQYILDHPHKADLIAKLRRRYGTA